MVTNELFRKTVYRGATCFICQHSGLRRILFRRRVVAFQVVDALLFKDEKTFNNPKIREHEYRHFLDWRKHKDHYLVRYTLLAAKKGYKKNPFEILARMAEEH